MPNLRIAELDFDNIKTNLKEFMKAQSQFSDYDFEGSGLSVLLDVLAYNTHYNAYLANMLVNEMFLDSAVKRSSAVSLAKHLGYTTRSARGSTAIVNIVVNNPTGSPSSLTIDPYTPFSTTIGDTSYQFLNTESITITPSNDVYRFTGVVLRQGVKFENTFVVVDPGTQEIFSIPNASIDTSTIKVTVQNSATDLTTTTYNVATDIVGLNGTSTVYFLQENPNGYYEIFFGDGTIGKKLTVGNIITIEYLSVEGEATNVSSLVTQSFTTQSIGGSSDINITTTSNSSGGSAKETISSIRYNAPLVNSARNRAVTAADYKALVEANFLDAESVAVWGGEENVPPKFGKVIISLKPFSGFTISQTAKDNLVTSILRSKKVITVSPEIVDPDYYYVNLTADVVYNKNVTTLNPSQIENIVRDVIANYFSLDLQKFDLDFNKSKLSKLILEADSSIHSVLFDVKLQKRLNLVVNTNNSFQGDLALRFNNKISPGNFTSSRFYVTFNGQQRLAKFADIPDTMPPDPNGTGTIRIVDAYSNGPIIINLGTINYSTGVVNILDFIPSGLQSGVNDIRFSAGIQTRSHNVQVFRNQILLLDDSNLNSSIGRDKGLSINVSGLNE